MIKEYFIINFMSFSLIRGNTVEPRYSAHNREMSKSMLYQSVHYIEVPYNFLLELNLNNSRHTV